VVPFGPEAVLANVNAGLLLLMAITSMEVYGIIIAGWASNSKYLPGRDARFGTDDFLRNPDGLRAGGRADGVRALNFGDIVPASKGMMAAHGLNFLSWNWLPLLPLFVVYLTPAWPKPTVTRSTWWKASRRSWPVTWSNTRAWPTPCSCWPNTPT
jgi:NADH-quinone oxidoreductase subunit H